MSSQFGLLKARRFAPFFGTQFLGAFNDNLYKNALVVLLTFQAASWTTLTPEVLTNLAAGLFILPFFLFSATAGQLADKYDKARLARLTKLLEIVIMGVALSGFMMHSLEVLLLALFLLGLQSALFGPVKYAILPQHLRENELVGGNALVESGTFVAILMGTLAGGILAGAAGHPTWVAFAGLLVAVVGYLCSRGIPPAAAQLRIWSSASTCLSRPGATSASRAKTARSFYRFSASPGSGCTVRCSWRSSRCIRRASSAVTRRP